MRYQFQSLHIFAIWKDMEMTTLPNIIFFCGKCKHTTFTHTSYWGVQTNRRATQYEPGPAQGFFLLPVIGHFSCRCCLFGCQALGLWRQSIDCKRCFINTTELHWIKSISLNVCPWMNLITAECHQLGKVTSWGRSQGSCSWRAGEPVVYPLIWMEQKWGHIL